MTDQELERLAMALQETRFPSRELDRAVVLGLEWQLLVHNDHRHWASPNGLGVWADNPPELTNSTDAARVLIPRGWGLTLHDPNPGHLRAAAMLQGALSREFVPLHGQMSVGTAWLVPCAILSAVVRAHVVMRSLGGVV